MSQYKTCTKCSQTQAFDAFGKSKLGKNGLRPQCKSCHNASNKAYRKANPDYQKAYCEANRGKIAAQRKAYRQENPEKLRPRRNRNPDYAKVNKTYRKANREKIEVVAKVWREANREKIAASARAWQQANRERVYLVSKAYQEANPEKSRLYMQKRRACKLNNGVFIVTIKELKRLYAGPCAYCDSPSQHVDHVIPLSRGGRHSIGNLVGACAPCNLSKNARFITEWKKSGLSGIL